MARWALQHEQSCYKLFYFTWRYRALLRSYAVQGRCIGPETRALLAAILSCHGSLYIVSSDCRTCWRAASAEAFALYVIVAGWTWCATSTASAAAASTATTPMHSPTHRRLRQALRRQRCTARPLFTRPPWPQRALRSHDYQRAPCKLSVPPNILPRRYAPAASVQSCSRLTSRSRVASYCRRVDLQCG
jgi:hypothetical protein